MYFPTGNADKAARPMTCFLKNPSLDSEIELQSYKDGLQGRIVYFILALWFYL